ncbi:MAG: archaeal fructose-1,6-bisphosphatase related enzymes of inositol monophosphatase family [halophilic archaeon J07HB67]|jgi:Archaeal fructose-1,6-bisphosphatase and related enzymes of inositol monophosphatase family|nr:MAG: archaeal fructose-1,6-bisphosphatase related enzymes of inositol monophosphatase family [halophilic archaeon J07HB67]
MTENSRATVAAAAARAGARVAADGFRDSLPVETKDGATDVVTAADREAQSRVVETIRESFPDDTVVGEEADQPKTVPETGDAWIVDPIDGTNNFVRGIEEFATAVAAVTDAVPTAAAVTLPVHGDTYHADETTASRNDEPISVSSVADPALACVVPTVWWSQERREEYARACEGIVRRFADLRRFGSAQAALARLAAGSVEGVVTNVDCNPWDTVAGVHLVRVAGGRVTNLAGEPWAVGDRGLVASNGAVHEEVLATAREVDSVAATETPELRTES